MKPISTWAALPPPGHLQQLWEHLEEEYDIEPSACDARTGCGNQVRAAHAPFAAIDPLSAQPDLLGEGELNRIASLAIKFAVAWMAAREFNDTGESGAQQVAGFLPEDCWQSLILMRQSSPQHPDFADTSPEPASF